MWVAAAAAAVVAGLVVLLAAFHEPDDRPSPRRHGPVTPDELRRATFPLTWRGYSPGHVDALLARAAASLEEAHQHTPSEVSEGTLPSFLQDTFDDSGVAGGAEVGPDGPAEHARRSGVAGGAEVGPDGPAEHARRSGVAGGAEVGPDGPAEHARRSGEELEDGGGNGAGGLDR